MGKYPFEDQRDSSDERTGRERRGTLVDPTYCGVERRSNVERRSGEERRRWFRLFTKLGCRPLYPVLGHPKDTPLTSECPPRECRFQSHCPQGKSRAGDCAGLTKESVSFRPQHS